MWAAVHDRQPWGLPIPEAESSSVVLGPVLPQNDGQSPSSSLSETSLCTGSVTTMTLRFFFTPKHDPTPLGLVSTQRAAPWGSCDLFPSSQGARAALVFFLSAGELPMLHPPGLCAPMFQEKAPKNTGWTLGWTPHPSSLLLKPAGRRRAWTSQSAMAGTFIFYGYRTNDYQVSILK